MKAIILAGGEGKRLRPLTATRPKPLMRVGDRTLLDILLERLAKSCVTEVMIAVGYKGDEIEREIGSSLHGVKIEYRREKTPLGTAGCVKNCADFIDSDVLIVPADALTNLDFSAMVKSHKETGAHVTIAVTERNNPALYGVVHVNQRGRITSFTEKPDMSPESVATVSCGIYVLKKEVVDLIPSATPFDFARDVFPLVRRNIFAHRFDGFWCDIGSFDEYMRSNLLTLSEGFFVARGSQPDGKGALLDSVIGKGTRVLSRAVVRHSVVGRNTRIGEGTRLDSCILGDGVTVGENVSISGGAVVGDFAIVGDGAVVGDGMRVEPYAVFMG